MSYAPRKTYNSSQLVRYVDPTGSDSYDGLSPQRAFATIQAAYNDLKTVAEATYTSSGSSMGIGRIYLMPGDHNVGNGLSFANDRPVELLGTRSGEIDHFMPNSASRIMSNSSTATEFILLSHATVNARGFVFNNIAFQMDHTVNTSLVNIIYAKNVDHLVVERCSFDNADNNTNTSVTAIWHEAPAGILSDDSAWARITRNNVSRMALYKASGVGSANAFNRTRISDNVVFYGGSLPMIGLAGEVNGLLCDGNNLEGTATAVEIGPTGAKTQCTFLNNSGEDPSAGTPTNPFYDVTCSCSQVIFMGGICSVPAGGTGTWVRFNHASAYNNLIIGPSSANGVAGYKRQIVDNSTANGNLILNPNHGIPAKYKSASGATISDADFTTGPPPNGTLGVAHDSSNSQDKFYYRVNGAWKFVDFNHLLTTKGDLLGFSTTAARLAVGGDGQVLTADSTQALGVKWAPANAGAASVVARTSDSAAIVSNTVLANDDTLKFGIGSSSTEVWFFDALLLIIAANATMDLKIGFSVPSGVSMAWGNGDIAGASVNPGFYSFNTASTPSSALSAVGTLTLGTNTGGQLMVRATGWVFGGGTSGNINLQFAQNTSDPGNLFIKKGSHLKYYQLAP